MPMICVLSVVYTQGFKKVTIHFMETQDGRIEADWEAYMADTNEIEELIHCGGSDVEGWNKCEL
jgi:hypothetical protein